MSSVADAARLAEDSGVADAWRAAIAHAAGVAEESVQLAISLVSQRWLGSLRGLPETAQITLSYVITLPSVPVATERQALLSLQDVFASIESKSEADLTTALADAAFEATGGGEFGLAVLKIGAPTQGVVLRSVTLTETTTSATGSATEAESESISVGAVAVLVVIAVFLVGVVLHTRSF